MKYLLLYDYGPATEEHGWSFYNTKEELKQGILVMLSIEDCKIENLQALEVKRIIIKPVDIIKGIELE